MNCAGWIMPISGSIQRARGFGASDFSGVDVDFRLIERNYVALGDRILDLLRCYLEVIGWILDGVRLAMAAAAN